MLLPRLDRVVDRDALVKGCRGVGKPAEQELRRSKSAPRQGTAERDPLLLSKRDQALGEVMGPP
jgi:hypothetical protein